jgi:hypothetical protein
VVLWALARLEQHTAANKMKEAHDVDIQRERFMRTFPVPYVPFESDGTSSADPCRKIQGNRLGTAITRDPISALLVFFKLIAPIMTYFKPTELGE